MKDEVSKVITMLQEGKISPDEASEIINLIKNNTDTQPKGISNETYGEKSLRIKVMSDHVTRVNVRIPIKLIKVFINLGRNIAASIPDAEQYVKDIDFDIIIEAIDQQIEGKIIDVETEEGDHVMISIE